jgi:Domain of unknown function (DUF4279)
MARPRTLGHHEHVTTRLHLVLRFRGASLDPAELTQRTGIEPSRSFSVGEGRGDSVQVGGWEWTSAPSDRTETLLDEMMRLFGANARVLRTCIGEDARVSLSVVGEVGGIVVTSAAQAQQRRIDWGSGPFKPFVDGDRVALSLVPEVVAFLAALGASIDTHIDLELADERPNWWETT